VSGGALSIVTSPVFESWTACDWSAKSLYIIRVVEIPKGLGSHESTHFATTLCPLSYGGPQLGFGTELLSQENSTPIKPTSPLISIGYGNNTLAKSCVGPEWPDTIFYLYEFTKEFLKRSACPGQKGPFQAKAKGTAYPIAA
jgi:hypothetical protein